MAFLNFRANYNTNKLVVKLACCLAGWNMRNTCSSGNRGMQTPLVEGFLTPFLARPLEWTTQVDAEDRLLFRGWDSGVNCDACLVPIVLNVGHD